MRQEPLEGLLECYYYYFDDWLVLTDLCLDSEPALALSEDKPEDKKDYDEKIHAKVIFIHRTTFCIWSCRGVPKITISALVSCIVKNKLGLFQRIKKS